MLISLLLLRLCHVQIIESFKEVEDLYNCNFKLETTTDRNQANQIYSNYLNHVLKTLDKYEKQQDAHLKIKSKYRELEDMNKQISKLMDEHTKLNSQVLKLKSELKFGLRYIIYNYSSTVYPFNRSSIPNKLNEGIIVKKLNSDTKYKSIKKSCMIEYKAFFIPEQNGVHQFRIDTNSLAMLYIGSKLLLTVDYTDKRIGTIEYDMKKSTVYSFCLVMYHDPSVKNAGTLTNKLYIRESELYTTHLDLSEYKSTDKVYILVTPSNTSANADIYLNIDNNIVDNIKSSIIILDGGRTHQINKYIKKTKKSYHKGVSQIIDNNNIRIGNNSWNIKVTTWNELGNLWWKHKLDTEWSSSYSKCFYQSIDTIQTIEKEKKKLTQKHMHISDNIKIRDNLEKSVLKYQIQLDNNKVKLPQNETIDDLYSKKYKLEEKIKKLNDDGLIELDNYVSTNENTPIISSDTDKLSTTCYKNRFVSDDTTISEDKYTKIGDNFYESINLINLKPIIYSDIHIK